MAAKMAAKSGYILEKPCISQKYDNSMNELFGYVLTPTNSFQAFLFYLHVSNSEWQPIYHSISSNIKVKVQPIDIFIAIFHFYTHVRKKIVYPLCNTSGDISNKNKSITYRHFI